MPGASVVRRAADAITNLAHENVPIKSRVRAEGGIPPLVMLLEAYDAKVQLMQLLLGKASNSAFLFSQHSLHHGWTASLTGLEGCRLMYAMLMGTAHVRPFKP